MTAEINCERVANALIAMFDKEVSPVQFVDFLSVLNLNESKTFFDIAKVMSQDDIKVIITTKNSRKIVEERKQIEKMFNKVD